MDAINKDLLDAMNPRLIPKATTVGDVMLCRNPECNQPLTQIEFTKGFESVCNNWQCYMYRRPQGCRMKEPETTNGSNHRIRSGETYEACKERKRQNYHLLRDIGIEPKAANLMPSSNTQTELALQWSKNE